MIGALLCLIALVSVWRTSRRSLGHGIGFAILWGYMYGILRARFPDGGTHFIFDAAVLGLYAGCFVERAQAHAAGPRPDRRLRPWFLALLFWPCLIVLIPYQNFFVQLVGLRAAIFFLPFLLLGARLGLDDLRLTALWIAAGNLVALGFAAMEFVLGVERFYPYSPVTELIYRSADVGPNGALRIPATFTNAHAFGGTMVESIPIVVAGWLLTREHRQRMLCLAGATAAAFGTFMCGARMPVVFMMALGCYLLTIAPLSSSRRAMALIVALVVGAIVLQSERFQRFGTLADTEKVTERLQGSVNLSFIEVILDHPMGEGLGSGAGTSIPFFLQHLAKPQLGLENEWSRIAVEQSLIGLALWLAFVTATLVRFPRKRRGNQPPVTALMWAYAALAWATTFVGTGMLTAIPGTGIILLYMGCLWREERRVRPAPVVQVAPAAGESVAA